MLTKYCWTDLELTIGRRATADWHCIQWHVEVFKSNAILEYWLPLFVCSMQFDRNKVSGMYRSRKVWHRNTKSYKDIHTNILYTHIGYGFTSYFRLTANWMRILSFLQRKRHTNGPRQTKPRNVCRLVEYGNGRRLQLQKMSYMQTVAAATIELSSTAFRLTSPIGGLFGEFGFVQLNERQIGNGEEISATNQMPGLMKNCGRKKVIFPYALCWL